MSLRYPVKYTQYRGHALVAAPDIEPVTVSDIKNQLELDVSDTSKDTQIELYIASARQIIEEYTGLALIDQQWRLELDHWPGDVERWWDGVKDGAITELVSTGRKNDVLLPRYPLQSVDSITADGTAVVIADTFVVDTAQKPGRLVIKRGATWPVVLDTASGIKITYTAGFSDSASEVPAALRLAVIQMAAYMYEHRGDCNTESAMINSGAQSMVDAYRIRGL